MLNTQIRQLRDTIITIANASPVPVEAKRLVLEEVARAFTKAADDVIVNEIKKENEEKKKREDNQNEQCTE